MVHLALTTTTKWILSFASLLQMRSGVWKFPSERWFVGREMDSDTSAPPAFPNGSLFSSTWGSCMACSLSVRRRPSIRYPDCQSIMSRTLSGSIVMSWSSAFAKEEKHSWWIEAVQEWAQWWSSFRWYWRLFLPICIRSLWNQDHSLTWIAYGCEVGHRWLNALQNRNKTIFKRSGTKSQSLIAASKVFDQRITPSVSNIIRIFIRSLYLSLSCNTKIANKIDTE